MEGAPLCGRGDPSVKKESQEDAVDDPNQNISADVRNPTRAFHEKRNKRFYPQAEPQGCRLGDPCRRMDSHERHHITRGKRADSTPFHG